MKKIFAIVLCICISTNIYAKPPKISGNYEQGSRYSIPYDEIEYPTWWFEETEDIDQESWAYNYDKGYLKLSQTINKGFKYTVKYDYLEKDFFAAASDNTNNKNRINYYRTYSWIGLPSNFRLKLEYYLRQQDYTFRTWDNLTHVPHLLLQWKPAKTKTADLSLKYKAQRYDEDTETLKDKNQVDSYIGYKEKVTDKLTINTKYKYTFRKYTDNPTESNAVRKSFSVGFDYQF